MDSSIIFMLLFTTLATLHRSGVVGQAAKNLTWPQKRIAYQIANVYSFAQREFITSAMSHLQKETCITFVPRFTSPNHNFVMIDSHDDTRCWAEFGYLEGKTPQFINLGKRSDCLASVGSVEFHLMYALGIGGQQQRPDRDLYVNLYVNNLEHDYWYLFKQLSWTTTFDLPYDYTSIMHIGKREHLKNKTSVVAQATKDPRICLGQRITATPCDLELIRRLYSCPNQSSEGCVTTTYVRNEGEECPWLGAVLP